jgi:hypothetical protein
MQRRLYLQRDILALPKTCGTRFQRMLRRRRLTNHVPSFPGSHISPEPRGHSMKRGRSIQRYRISCREGLRRSPTLLVLIKLLECQLPARRLPKTKVKSRRRQPQPRNLLPTLGHPFHGSTLGIICPRLAAMWRVSNNIGEARAKEPQRAACSRHRGPRPAGVSEVSG